MMTSQIGDANTTVALRERQLARFDARFLDLFLERIETALAASPSAPAPRPGRETLSPLTVHHLLATLDHLCRCELARHEAMRDRAAPADDEAVVRAVGATA